jgi:hypothetical protein
MSVSGGSNRSGEVQLWAVGHERHSVVDCRKLVAFGALISDVVTVLDEVRCDWL